MKNVVSAGVKSAAVVLLAGISLTACGGQDAEPGNGDVRASETSAAAPSGMSDADWDDFYSAGTGGWWSPATAKSGDAGARLVFSSDGDSVSMKVNPEGMPGVPDIQQFQVDGVVVPGQSAIQWNWVGARNIGTGAEKRLDLPQDEIDDLRERWVGAESTVSMDGGELFIDFSGISDSYDFINPLINPDAD